MDDRVDEEFILSCLSFVTCFLKKFFWWISVGWRLCVFGIAVSTTSWSLVSLVKRLVGAKQLSKEEKHGKTSLTARFHSCWNVAAEKSQVKNGHGLCQKREPENGLGHFFVKNPYESFFFAPHFCFWHCWTCQIQSGPSPRVCCFRRRFTWQPGKDDLWFQKGMEFAWGKMILGGSPHLKKGWWICNIIFM